MRLSQLYKDASKINGSEIKTLTILKILERHLWMHQTYDMIFLSSEDLFEYQLSMEKKNIPFNVCRGFVVALQHTVEILKYYVQCKS